MVANMVLEIGHYSKFFYKVAPQGPLRVVWLESFINKKVLVVSVGCAKIYTVVVPKVLGCIAPRAYIFLLATNVSPSEKYLTFCMLHGCQYVAGNW